MIHNRRICIVWVAHVRQIVKLPHDNFRIIVEGEYRATAVEIVQTSPYYVAVVQERCNRPVTPALLEAALVRECRQQFERYADLVSQIAPDVLYTVAADDDAGHLADYDASNLNMPVEACIESSDGFFAYGDSAEHYG